MAAENQTFKTTEHFDSDMGCMRFRLNEVHESDGIEYEGAEHLMAEQYLDPKRGYWVGITWHSDVSAEDFFHDASDVLDKLNEGLPEPSREERYLGNNYRLITWDQETGYRHYDATPNLESDPLDPEKSPNSMAFLKAVTPIGDFIWNNSEFSGWYGTATRRFDSEKPLLSLVTHSTNLDVVSDFVMEHGRSYLPTRDVNDFFARIQRRRGDLSAPLPVLHD